MIEMVIEARRKDLGGFEVGRVLPFAQRRMVGRFSFLDHMGRIIVGTLVDVGRGSCAPGAIARAQKSGERTDLGMTAPPDGLCLERIELADSGHDEWPNHW